MAGELGRVLSEDEVIRQLHYDDVIVPQSSLKRKKSERIKTPFVNNRTLDTNRNAWSVEVRRAPLLTRGELKLSVLSPDKPELFKTTI